MDSRSPRRQLQPAVTDIALDIRDELKSDLPSIPTCTAPGIYSQLCSKHEGEHRYFTKASLAQIYDTATDVKSLASKTFQEPNSQRFVKIKYS